MVAHWVREKKTEYKTSRTHTKYRTNMRFHLNLFQINWFWLAFGFNIASNHSANMMYIEQISWEKSHHQIKVKYEKASTARSEPFLFFARSLSLSTLQISLRSRFFWRICTQSIDTAFNYKQPLICVFQSSGGFWRPFLLKGVVIFNVWSRERWREKAGKKSFVVLFPPFY